jgi:hypothetical protein
MRTLFFCGLLLAQGFAAPQNATTHLEFQLLQTPLIQQRLEALPRKFSQRGTVLQSLFQDAGCSDLTTERVPSSSDPNVICALAGQEPDTIVVGAHLDAIARGSGAVDDWSGAALLPSQYQSLQNTAPRHRILFIGFAAEEIGLVGSAAYVRFCTVLATSCRPSIAINITICIT